MLSTANQGVAGLARTMCSKNTMGGCTNKMYMRLIQDPEVTDESLKVRGQDLHSTLHSMNALHGVYSGLCNASLQENFP